MKLCILLIQYIQILLYPNIVISAYKQYKNLQWAILYSYTKSLKSSDFILYFMLSEHFNSD